MAVSIFDLFKIGIGPSSSHTVGPMRAAWRFVVSLQHKGLLAQTQAVRIELFGSLGATGRGHGSDKAILLGLAGETPEQVDPAQIDSWLAQIRGKKQLSLLGQQTIAFDEKQQLIFHRKSLPYHPNGMRFTAYGAGDEEAICRGNIS